jgi:hypothetical protein
MAAVGFEIVSLELYSEIPGCRHPWTHLGNPRIHHERVGIYIDGVILGTFPVVGYDLDCVSARIVAQHLDSTTHVRR